MSNLPNPYASPVTPTDANAIKLRTVAKRLASFRAQPPTFLNLLSQSYNLLLFVILGLLFTTMLTLICRTLGSDFGYYYPAVFLGSMFLGGFLREINTLRRFPLSWRLQQHFIDWKKVDEYL